MHIYITKENAMGQLNYTTASQGTPKLASKPPEAGKRQGFPYRLQREHGPARNKWY